jgi:hypothetical protein
MTAEKARRYTAAEVRAALMNRYCAPEWATFFEVANSTGGGAVRSADAVAMSLYPSRGLRLHGFEIKVSRSDWLHELKQPDKSVAVQRFAITGGSSRPRTSSGTGSCRRHGAI